MIQATFHIGPWCFFCPGGPKLCSSVICCLLSSSIVSLGCFTYLFVRSRRSNLVNFPSHLHMPFHKHCPWRSNTASRLSSHHSFFTPHCLHKLSSLVSPPFRLRCLEVFRLISVKFCLHSLNYSELFTDIPAPGWEATSSAIFPVGSVSSPFCLELNLKEETIQVVLRASSAMMPATALTIYACFFLVHLSRRMEFVQSSPRRALLAASWRESRIVNRRDFLIVADELDNDWIDLTSMYLSHIQGSEVKVISPEHLYPRFRDALIYLRPDIVTVLWITMSS